MMVDAVPALQAVPQHVRVAVAECVDNIRAGCYTHAEVGDDWLVFGQYGPDNVLAQVKVTRGCHLVATLEA